MEHNPFDKPCLRPGLYQLYCGLSFCILVTKVETGRILLLSP